MTQKGVFGVTQAIWIVGMLSAVGLLGVTALLIYLNWNQQLGGTLLSVFLGGTVTLFIAVFAQLKESTISEQFAVEIPFDVSTGFPPFSLEKLPARRLYWLSRLHSIAVQPHLPPPQPGQLTTINPASIARPTTDDEMFVACSQLLQYKLLEDLRDNQSSSYARPPVVDGHEIPSMQAPNLVAPVADYPTAALQELLALNRFHSPHAFMWQHRTLRVPSHSQVQLRHVPSSETTGVTKDLIVFERPNYFRGVITIEPLGAAGSVPVKTVRLAVSMKATMFKLAAGSSESVDAKAWFEWLFKMLAEVNAS